jgi:hypothetical protein
MKTLSDRIKFIPIEEEIVKSSNLDTSFVGKEVLGGKVIEVGPSIREVKVGDYIKFKKNAPVYIQEKDIKVGFIPEADVFLTIRDNEKG